MLHPVNIRGHQCYQHQHHHNRQHQYHPEEEKQDAADAQQQQRCEQFYDDTLTDRSWAGPGYSMCGAGRGDVRASCLARSLGVELAPISPLELLNVSCSGDADDLLPPDPPTVVINSEASPPTEKQKRIARVVMGVAFVLLATCVILVGVTLSMSDHIDDLVRKYHFRGGFISQQQPHQRQSRQPAAAGSPNDEASASSISYSHGSSNGTEMGVNNNSSGRSNGTGNNDANAR